MLNRRGFLAVSTVGVALALSGRAAEWATQHKGKNPFLSGDFAPVADELAVTRLPIKGRLPAGLRGTYLRNGPNPAYPPLSYTYPFDGDGMIHSVTFEDDRVSYRNRYVQTQGLIVERRAGHAVYGSMMRPIQPDPASLGHDEDHGPIKNVANTNIVRHAGRYLALYEAGLPYEVTETLETRGRWDFHGAIPRMTAHPKIDPVSGELLMFYYSARLPELVFVTVDAGGRATRRTPIELSLPLMIHDFAVTERYAVFFCCPSVFDLQAGAPILQWHPELGTRIAIVPRNGDPIRWVEAEPFFVFHFLNAYEEDGKIIVDFVRHETFGQFGQGKLARAVITVSDGARLSLLDDHKAEFPRTDPERVGRKHRHGWTTVRTSESAAIGAFNALGHYDAAKSVLNVREFGSTREVDEPVFVADRLHDPNGGWIMTYLYDRVSDSSTLVVLDALDIKASPVAEVLLPRRVPHGFHGNWIPSDPQSHVADSQALPRTLGF